MKLRLIQTSGSYRITSFFIKEGTSEELAVTASELSSCYHNVKHRLNYNSFDYNTKLSCHIFRDSGVGSKLSVEEQKLRPW
jgi:hypothetical protein